MDKEKKKQIWQQFKSSLEDDKITEFLKQVYEKRRLFHNYSIFNTMLILSQKRNATLVKGFKQWNELGRRVKKGEKGIYIYVPVVKKQETKDERDKELDELGKMLFGDQYKPTKFFIMKPVFDISQTEGKDIDLAEFTELRLVKYNVDNQNQYQKLYNDSVAFLQSVGYNINIH